MTDRFRLRALIAVLALSGASGAVAQPLETVIFDENDPPGSDFYEPSTGETSGTDFLSLVEGRMPIESARSFSGSVSGVLSYRHALEGAWYLTVSPLDGGPIDLTGFDSLIVHLNGPEAIAGGELPRVGLQDAAGGRSALRWLSEPQNVAVDESASGFTEESPTNLTLSARYVGQLPSDLRRPGYPEDLVMIFADAPLDTSSAGIGIPAKPANFRIESASGLRLSFRFRDLDDDGTLSGDGEYVDVLSPTAEGSDQQAPTWRVEAESATDPGSLQPPGEGDVYRLAVALEEFALDDDPETWQRLSIPVTDLTGGSGISLASVASVLFTNGGVNEDARTLWIDRIVGLKNDDDAFLEFVQRATFDFFWFEANPSNGLVKDRSTPGSPASIAAVGFALSAYTVGIDRGWITREEGRARVLTTLRFFWNATQGTAVDATGYKGLFYHFLDMNTGRRAWTSELSTIDSALLLGGVLHMRTYFTGDGPEEEEIRELADAIYERVDWQWAQARPPAISHGWYPDPAGRANADPQTGFIIHDWIGYNEAMILYILALGSPTHPVGPDAWQAWTSGYVGQWQTHYGYSFLSFPPLFGHQYSHVWIDFRGIQDEYMRGQGIDYFENSRRATLAQRAYHLDNPRGWPNYDSDEWGLTASDTPTGYRARGAPPAQNDDGTLVPTAPGGSIAFTPDESIAALRNMYQRYTAQLWGPYGFRDAYNVSANWFDQAYLGIDQGPIILMIENHRTASIWSDFMSHEAVTTGLIRAGFEGETLSNEPQVPRPGTIAISLYPNPVARRMYVSATLPDAAHVHVHVYDALGRRVATLADQVMPSGDVVVEFEAGRLAAGVYVVRVEAGDAAATRSFVIVR